METNKYIYFKTKTNGEYDSAFAVLHDSPTVKSTTTFEERNKAFSI